MDTGEAFVVGNELGDFTCSGRKPMPTRRAFSRRIAGKRWTSRSISGGVSFSALFPIEGRSSVLFMTRFWIRSWKRCVRRVGKSRRVSTWRR
jgi:hypothetical protein